MSAIDRALRLDGGPARTLALRHAAIHQRPGLWCDDPGRVRSVVWLREADRGRREAFGVGRPGPAIAWLAGRAEGRPIALLAPPSWEAPIRARGDRLDRATVQTWTRTRPGPTRRPGPARVRPLGPGDGPAFESIAPLWALGSWGDFARMIDRGAAFGVPTGQGLAAIGWVYEADDRSDKIGVATAAPFQRLGLGHAVASVLVDHILHDRQKLPHWTTHAGNLASMALARILGFADPISETLLHWAPRGSENPVGS